MFLRRKKKQKIRAALDNRNLQNALKKASSHHSALYQKTVKEIPWQEYKEKARAIREECVKRLPELINKFREEATKAGARVYSAPTSDEALSLVGEIAHQKKARLIVKAKSMVSEEIHLNEFLEKRGYRVIETDLGEWIVQLAREKPSHITAPALHKTKEEVAELLSRHLGKSVTPEAKEIMRVAREEMRKHFIAADIGISGANLAIAESGTLVILSNEGNARLTTALPPVHIALVTTEKFVETMEQAVTLIKALTVASSGLKLTSYVSFITGPSKTTDIEKELVIGAHGPQELHIIILDNGRLEVSLDEDFKEILFCLKCGGCMLHCPVFQAVGGHVFGGPVYPGGIGILLTAISREEKDLASLIDFCADCKKCEDFCPVGIHTGALLLSLKNKIDGPSWQKALSSLLRRKRLSEWATKTLFFLQKFWAEDGHWKKLPLPWAKDKLFPAIHPQKFFFLSEGKGQKIYFFQGCLAKYFFPEIGESLFRVLSHFDFQVVSPADQVCCGAPSLHLGCLEDVRKLARINLKSLEKESPDYILTACPAGNSILKNLYPKIIPGAESWQGKIFDFTEFMVKKGLLPHNEVLPPERKIFYHYPCHYVHDLKLEKEPLFLLQSLGFDAKKEEEPYTCCGFCGLFSFKNPEISADIWKRKKEKILASNASLIATDCPGCLFQLRSCLKKEKELSILHSAEIYAQILREKQTVKEKADPQ